MAKKPASRSAADPTTDLADLVPGAAVAPGSDTVAAEAGAATSGADAALDSPIDPASQGNTDVVLLADLVTGDDASAALMESALPVPAALPEIILHSDLPIAIDARWLDGDAALLVTAVLLPGFELVAPAAAPTPIAPIEADAELPILDPDALLAWRALEVEPDIIVGVTRDGRKVRGRFA